MRAKSVILILIALGCGLIASIGISQVLEKNNSSKAPVVEMAGFYVASTDIQINEIMTTENVCFEECPQAEMPAGAIQEFEDCDGQFSRVRLSAGEVLLKDKLQNATQGKSSFIEEGYRVLPIKVSAETISGLVEPGDRIDIIAYLRKSKDVPRTMTKTILRNVRVFAVGSQTERVNEDGTSGRVQTISVLIKREQAPKLLLAMELGRLKLTLRRPDDTDEDFNSGVITVDELIGNVAQMAGDDQKSLDASGQDFVDFLNRTTSSEKVGQRRGNGSPSEKDAWQMEIHNGQGSKETYRWSSRDSAPELIRRSADRHSSRRSGFPIGSQDTDKDLDVEYGVEPSSFQADELDAPKLLLDG
ncbi:MAG: Flp pilus assembly protein CpaB [Pirellulaceae bacterium]|nr:Flp pilus assembly protein CpaB [Pirellulaceae bacterium]